MYVLWKNIISYNVSVSNWGIFSPYLFCVYLDDLSNTLNKGNAGCIISSMLMNYSMNADDVKCSWLLHLWVYQCYYLCVQDVD